MKQNKLIEYNEFKDLSIEDLQLKIENNTKIDLKDIKKYSIDTQWILLNTERQRLFKELLENFEHLGNNTEYGIQQCKLMGKIFIYETKTIDKQLNEIRELTTRKELKEMLNHTQ